MPRFPRLLATLTCALPIPVLAQTGAKLVLTQDLRIDPATADLTRMGTMVVSRSGEMIITQPDDQTIRVFSATGAASRFGHGGEGPGEFRENWVAGWLGDSLWVLDAELRRVSIFSPAHKFVRSFPEPAAVVDAKGNSVEELYFMGVYPDGSLRAVAAYR